MMSGKDTASVDLNSNAAQRAALVIANRNKTMFVLMTMLRPGKTMNQRQPDTHTKELVLDLFPSGPGSKSVRSFTAAIDRHASTLILEYKVS